MPGQDYWRHCKVCKKNTPHKPVDSIKNALTQLLSKHAQVKDACEWCGEVRLRKE